MPVVKNGKVSKITRLEIIEDAKRKYVKWNCNLFISLQDNGRTLKIFVEREQINFQKKQKKF